MRKTKEMREVCAKSLDEFQRFMLEKRSNTLAGARHSNFLVTEEEAKASPEKKEASPAGKNSRLINLGVNEVSNLNIVSFFEKFKCPRIKPFQRPVLATAKAN